MSTEENKALVKRWNEQGYKLEDPTALIDETWAEDVVINRPGMKLEGRDQLKRYVADTKAALHDFQFTVKAMIAEGDSVAIHVTLSVTHAGELMGIAATGKRITITATAILRIVNGKIAEVYEDYDALGMMKQIGAI